MQARAMESGKQWIARASLEATLDAILTGQVSSVVVGGYLIVYDVGGEWHSPDASILMELLVLRLDSGPGNFRVVPRALIALAEHLECTAILVGTAAASDDRLTRVYRRFGFRVEAIALYKEI